MQKPKSLFKISALAAVMLHGINRIIDTTSVNSNTKPSGKFYHWKHGDIYYKKSGQGEPILLIHDLTVFSSNFEWSRTIETLSKNYTVYAIDLIGCGKSDKPEITYTNFFYVQMLTDFVKDVIGTKTKVAATGLSGSFVLMTNSIHEELFSEVILVNPKSVAFLKQTPDERSKMLLRLFSIPIIGKTAYYIATNKPNTEYYLTEKCFYNPFKVTSSTIKAYYNAAHSSSGKGKALLSSLEGNYINADVLRALKNATNKITLVLGDHLDKKSDIEKSYTRINPEINVKVVPETKSIPQLEEAGRFIEILNQL